MSRSLKWLFGGVALLAFGATGAAAQNISNETWLGQIGGTNVITIDQSGRYNQAGADNMSLRLNQNGSDNVLTIDQFGHWNRIGAALNLAISGINQNGDRNEADVTQRTGAAAFAGGNVVGAILQTSPFRLLQAANILTVVQVGSGEGDHVIGTVRQLFTGRDGDLPNEASITQEGGGPGEGNFLGELLQSGIGNMFTLLQRDTANRVVSARQVGVGNSGEIEQRAGDRNLVEYLQQSGYRNRVEVLMDGSRNVIERIFQFNRHLGPGADANTATVAIHGQDNGGASGGTGQFHSPLALFVSAPQASIVQSGEGNDVAIAIAGNENMFGTQQFGDDNKASIAIGNVDSNVTGSANEAAIFQAGDRNLASHKALGDRNVAAVRQFGSDNRLSIEQVSTSNLPEGARGNHARVVVVGSRNNTFLGDATTFSDLVVSELAASGLPALIPGQLYQKGLENVVKADIYGNDNRFAFHQDGNGNLVESAIFGSGNQVAVVQVGNNNVASVAQYGSGNSAVILQ